MNRILPILVSAWLATTCVAIIPGTVPVTSTIAPTAPGSHFGVQTPVYGNGGFLTGASGLPQLQDLGWFPMGRRIGHAGMVGVTTNLEWYILGSDLTTWLPSAPLVNVFLASGFSTLDASKYPPNTILATLGNTTYTNGSGGYYQIVDAAGYPADGLGIVASANGSYNLMLVNNGNPWNVKQIGFPTDGNDILAKTQTALYNDRYDKLYFPTGIWPYSSQWAVTNGANGRTNGSITIIGDGSRLTIFRPTSAYSVNAPNATAPSDNSVAFDFKGFNMIHLKGFSKQYPSAPTWGTYTNWYQTTFVARAYGIRIRNSTNVTVEDVALYNNIHIGIGITDCYNVLLSHLWVTNTIKDGIVFDATQSGGDGAGLVRIDNCTVNAFGDTGIGVIESGFVTNVPPREFYIGPANVVSGPKDFSGRYVFPICSPQALTIIGVSDVTVFANTFNGGIGNTVVQARAGTNFGYNPGTNLMFFNNKVTGGVTNDYYFTVDGYENAQISHNIFQNNQGTLSLQSGKNVGFTDNHIIGNILWRPPLNGVTTNLFYIVYSPGGAGSVTYNSVTYTNRQTFAGAYGVTNYTVGGDGQLTPRLQGAIRVAGQQQNTTIRGNFFGPLEGPVFNQTISPDHTFFEDNNIPSSWGNGYDPFYGLLQLDVGGDGFILGSRNYFGGSTNFVHGPVVINGPNENRIQVTDYGTDLLSHSTILGTTNLLLTLPDIGVTDFKIYAIQTSPGQNTNFIGHFAWVQMVGATFDTSHWTQVTNGESANRRLLRNNDVLSSLTGVDIASWTATTNLQGRYLLRLNFPNKNNIFYQVNGQDH